MTINATEERALKSIPAEFREEYVAASGPHSRRAILSRVTASHKWDGGVMSAVRALLGVCNSAIKAGAVEEVTDPIVDIPDDELEDGEDSVQSEEPVQGEGHVQDPEEPEAEHEGPPEGKDGEGQLFGPG